MAFRNTRKSLILHGGDGSPPGRQRPTIRVDKTPSPRHRHLLMREEVTMPGLPISPRERRNSDQLPTHNEFLPTLPGDLSGNVGRGEPATERPARA